MLANTLGFALIVVLLAVPLVWVGILEKRYKNRRVLDVNRPGDHGGTASGGGGFGC